MDKSWRLIAVEKLVEERIFLLLCAGVAITMPFKPGWNSIFSILLFLFWLLFQKKVIDPKSINVRLVLLLSSLFLMSLIGLTYTENLEDGLFRIQLRAVPVMFLFIFSSIEINLNKVIRVIATCFVFSLLFACIVTLIDSSYTLITSGKSHKFFGHDLASLINMYPYLFALYCLIAILFLLNDLSGNKHFVSVWGGKNFKVILIVFFSVFILLLSVKQVIISWLVVLLIFLYSSIKSYKYGVLMSIVAMLMLILSVVLIPTLNQKVNQLIHWRENVVPLDEEATLGRSWDGVALRWAIWTCSVDVIKENFWLGTGTGDTQNELQAVYEKRQFYFASRYNRFNAHNQFLQVFLNLGLMGFILFIGAFIVPIYMLRNHRIYWVFAFCILSSCLTESMFEVNKGILIYSLFNPLLLFWKLQEDKSVS
jgi:O-antigen ligase